MTALDVSLYDVPPRLYGRHGDPGERVQAIIDLNLAGRHAPRILEAGCGSLTRVRLPEDAVLVGIDIEQRQLDRNTSLQERILGDVQSHDWPPDSFDMIISWDVIEHLSDPISALDRFARSLRDGGIIVLAFPNLYSLKGIVTKATPFWFHAAFYRYIIGDKRRVKEWDQFPTYFRSRIAPARLRAWAKTNGLSVAYDEVYEGVVQTHLRRRSRFMNFGFGALGLLSRLITLGQLDLGLSDCVLVLKRTS